MIIPKKVLLRNCFPFQFAVPEVAIIVGMKKRLYRSRTNKMIAGVCGGLAEYFDIDPVIIRILFFILLLPGGLPGLLPYIILWIVVPKEPTAEH